MEKPGKIETQVPIKETDNSVAYLGVELEKTKGDENRVPQKGEWYKNFINDKYTNYLQQKFAVSFKMGEPILVEGGTSTRKTTTVMKMCADLGWEVYYINLNGSIDVENLMGKYIPNVKRKEVTDPEYKFADGNITSGLRQEDEKIKVIILDEINATNPAVLKRLNEVLDAVEKDGQVILTEDASEAVKVKSSKTKVVGLMNPPGEGFLGVEPLSKELIRRWVYHKGPSELPGESFDYSIDYELGLVPKTEEMPSDSFLVASENVISIEQMREIPGIRETASLYKEFHKAAKEALKIRKIAQDQPQNFMFDDNEERRRVFKFIRTFYRGDITETFQRALRYFYSSKLQDAEDKEFLEEQIKHIVYVPPVESRRKSAERERTSPDPEELNQQAKEWREKMETIAKIEEARRRIEESGKVPEGFFEEVKEGLSGELSEQIKNAREILGKKDVLGPEEIEKTFGLKLKTEDIPKIPFGKVDLERAKELGQFLILRVDKAKDGTGLSMKTMHDLLAKEFEKEDYGKILASIDWYKEENFFTKETPRLSWALTSKEVIPNSVSKNYLKQIEEIVNYLKNKVFEKRAVPKDYEEAINEFSEKKGKIEKLMEENWQEATQELENLKITKLTRQSPSEFLYDFLVYFKSNKERLLENMYTWSSRRDSDGRLVRLGGAGADGARVGSGEPDDSNDALGVVFSRSI